jgi:DNA polymerase-3 subunit epsilon
MNSSFAPGLLLILDCETTGTDPNVHDLCEVGAILFSVHHRAVIQQLSFLAPILANPAQAINGIPPDLTVMTIAASGTGIILADMAHCADAFVAHNADFDRQWLAGGLPDKPWICTCTGIDWPGLRLRPSLRDLALHYGVPVWAAHRALTDCTYLAQVFERDPLLQEHLQEGLLPQELVAACVGFDQKELAKAAGFYWEPQARQWRRRCNEMQIAALPFEVRAVDA